MGETERIFKKADFEKKDRNSVIAELELPLEIKKRAEKIAYSKNGVLDPESFEKIVDVLRSGHNLRFLERMVELSRGQDIKDLVQDWASHFPLYSLREKTDIKKWRKRLSDPDEVKKSKEIAEEIGKEFESIGINLKNSWDFGFRVRQRRRKEKIISEKENLIKIFKDYGMPRAVDGEELINFVNLPSDWKKKITERSDVFREKLKALEIKCDSLSQLVDAYKNLESRKFRRKGT